MQEFFTWSMLATYAGATLATNIITQLFKGTGFIAKIPTRLFSYAVALIVLLAATLFSGSLDWSSGALCAVNAAVVSLASNGAYDAVKQKSSK